ncbi:DUF6542 domain-containing protein [Streptomyces sp. WMMC897]|uniref:DUF6542 domain-containing protein n=1 Tax=Streptomyces sp. WMMC897 TaxID=3014782 RepID=UPI002FC2784D
MKGERERVPVPRGGRGRRPVRPRRPVRAPVRRDREARREARPGVVRRPPAVVAKLSAMRLTALGSGLLTITAMVVLGGLVRWLLDASTTAYGCCFVLVGLASALWVRPADAFTAPVVAPIAYATGLVLLTGGAEDGGFGARVMTFVTTLAVEAGWVYGGTLATGAAAVVRRAVLAAARRGAAREAAAGRRPGPLREPGAPARPEPGPGRAGPPRSRRPSG